MPTVGLLRTNPKLTSNVKIVVDTDNNLYLDIISVEQNFSDNRYTSIKVNPDNRYAYDLYKFYGKKTIDKNVIFTVQRQNPDTKLITNPDYQFEQHYNYGATKCRTNFYKGSNCIFAPLLIENKVLPKYFIIFKAPGARALDLVQNPDELVAGVTYKVYGDATVGYNNQQYNSGDTFVAEQGGTYQLEGDGYIIIYDPDYEYANSVNPVTIGRQFIMDSEVVKVIDLRNSNIGKYLTNHVNDVNFTDKNVRVDYREKTATYTGINIDNGVIGSKVERLEEYLSKERSIIDFDDYITSGFGRNNIVTANILNIEFTFDTEDEHKFNRYFGFYCDDIPFGSFLPDYSMIGKGGDYHNSFWNEYNIPIKYPTDVTDEEGIRILVDQMTIDGFLPRDTVNVPSMYFIKDKFGNIKKINNDSSEVADYRLQDTVADISDFYGFNTPILVGADRALEAGKARCFIDLADYNINTGFQLNLLNDGVYIGKIVGDHLPTLFDELGIVYGEGENHYFYFYPTGTKQQINEAFVGAFNYAFENTPFGAEIAGDEILISSVITGRTGNRYSLEMTNRATAEVWYKDINGGTATSKSRAIIDRDYNPAISTDSYILTNRGYSRIETINVYSEDTNNKVVVNIVDDNQEIIFRNGNISVFNRSRLIAGVLSFYDMKDFDFDFHTSSYSKFYSNEYQKYFDVKTLEIGQTYQVFSYDNKTASILHNGILYDSYILSTAPGTFTAVNTEYEVVDNRPIIIDVRFLEDEELKQFIGFNSMVQQSSYLDIEDTDLVENKIKIFSTESDTTEYDELKENKASKNILKSRVVPSTNKWVLRGSNVRGDEYRLNFSHIFGELNFTPSFDDAKQNPLYFTHEWYYLAGLPKNITIADLLDSNSYFSYQFQKERLYDPVINYFDEYFVVDDHTVHNGTDWVDIVIPTQRRYSVFERVSDTRYATFFRGVRIEIDSEKDYSNYKFSAILTFETTTYLDPKEPYKIEVIENDKYKNITYLITVVIDDYKIVDSLGDIYPDYIYLYIMNSLKDYDGTLGELVYGKIYDYPSIPGFSLFRSPDLITPVTDFRGYQLPYKVNMQGASSQDHMRFASNLELPFYLTANIDGNYSRLIGMDLDNVFLITSDNAFLSPNNYVVNNPTRILSVDGNEVLLDTSGISLLNIPSLTVSGNLSPFNINFGVYDLSSLVWFHEDGGRNVYDRVAKLLSFASIADLTNNTDFLDYKKANNEESIFESSNLKLRFVRPTKIIKDKVLKVRESRVNARGVPESMITDYVEYEQPIENRAFYRYSGDYRPKLKSVISFITNRLSTTWSLTEGEWQENPYMWQDYEPLTGAITAREIAPGDEKTPLGKAVDKPDIVSPSFSYSLRDLNTLFNLNDKFGCMDNFYFHKYADTNLLRVAQPIYTSANQIAIDRKKMNAFSSDLDAKYYRKQLTEGNYTEIEGYNSLLNSKSFFGSKILSLPKIVTLKVLSENVQLSSVPLDKDYEFPDTSTDMVYTINEGNIDMVISVRNLFIKYMIENSFAEFQRWFGEPTMENFIKYIDLNILQIIDIRQISVYSKPVVGGDFITNESDELILISQGYTQDKNFGNLFRDHLKPLIKFNKSVDKDYSFSISITIDV